LGVTFFYMRKLLIPYWGLCFLLTHLPPSSAVSGAEGVDKILHFSGYSILGFLLQINLKQKWNALLILLLYSVIDEFTQPYVGRDFEWLDIAADFLGSSLGVSLGPWLLSKISPQK
ncbi:MAG: VanZ family protein, partial [Pseudomonadota bacterium]